jgi:hypothetical protein
MERNLYLPKFNVVYGSPIEITTIKHSADCGVAITTTSVPPSCLDGGRRRCPDDGPLAHSLHVRKGLVVVTGPRIVVAQCPSLLLIIILDVVGIVVVVGRGNTHSSDERQNVPLFIKHEMGPFAFAENQLSLLLMSIGRCWRRTILVRCRLCYQFDNIITPIGGIRCGVPSSPVDRKGVTTGYGQVGIGSGVEKAVPMSPRVDVKKRIFSTLTTPIQVFSCTPV